MIPELRECPFCGEQDAYFETFTTSLEITPRYRVSCANCGASIDWDSFSLEEAAYKWNRRAKENQCDYSVEEEE